MRRSRKIPRIQRTRKSTSLGGKIGTQLYPSRKKMWMFLEIFQDLTNFQTKPKVILSAFPEPQLPENKGPFSVMMSQQYLPPDVLPYEQYPTNLFRLGRNEGRPSNCNEATASWPVMTPPSPRKNRLTLR